LTEAFSFVLVHEALEHVSVGVLVKTIAVDLALTDISTFAPLHTLVGVVDCQARVALQLHEGIEVAYPEFAYSGAFGVELEDDVAGQLGVDPPAEVALPFFLELVDALPLSFGVFEVTLVVSVVILFKSKCVLHLVGFYYDFSVFLLDLIVRYVLVI